MSGTSKQKRLKREMEVAAKKCCSLPDEIVQTAALFVLNAAEVTGQQPNVDNSLLKSIATGKFTAHGKQKESVYFTALSAGWVAPKREKTSDYLKGDEAREARELLTKFLREDRAKTLAATSIENYGLAGRIANGAVPSTMDLLIALRGLSKTSEPEPAPSI